jgi:hypothetical protein
MLDHVLKYKTLQFFKNGHILRIENNIVKDFINAFLNSH